LDAGRRIAGTVRDMKVWIDLDITDAALPRARARRAVRARVVS